MVYGVMGLWGLLGSILARQLLGTAIEAACGQGWMRWGGGDGNAGAVIILHVQY